MNALQNMECVKNGSSSLKEQSIIAMNTVMIHQAMQFRENGKSEEAVAKFEAQAKSLEQKAMTLSDEFFAGIDCEWNNEGLAIARAVSAA